MEAKDLSKIGIIAAIYAVLTILLSPISYGPLQFRLSEVLKPLALKGTDYVLGLTIGLFLANLFSPYISVWELVFMPFMCLFGGYIVYKLNKRPYLAVIFYSFWIALGVSITLNVTIGLPLVITFPGVFVSELILMLFGLGVVVNVILYRITPTK